MTTKLRSISISPVNIVNTKRGETYVMSHGETRSSVTPRNEPQVVRALIVGLAMVRYNTWTMIMKTTGMVKRWKCVVSANWPKDMGSPNVASDPR